jgi:hypothetical protein
MSNDTNMTRQQEIDQLVEVRPSATPPPDTPKVEKAKNVKKPYCARCGSTIAQLDYVSGLKGYECHIDEGLWDAIDWDSDLDYHELFCDLEVDVGPVIREWTDYAEIAGFRCIGCWKEWDDGGEFLRAFKNKEIVAK